MKYLSILFLFIPLFVFGQDGKNYLAGAVPEIDGKVVFNKEIRLPGFSQQQVYDLVHEWASSKYPGDKNRVVYEDRVKGDIAIVGETYLVFTSKALSLDRTLFTYRLMIKCEEQNCNLSVTGIRYEYNVSYQKEPEKYTAEDWITDKNALTKGKLNRLNGKFRTGTIDFVDDLFQEVVEFLTVKATAVTPSTTVSERVVTIPVAEATTSTSSVSVVSEPKPVVVPPVAVDKEEVKQPAVVPVGSLNGYRQVAPDKIPGNIIKMLSEDWMLITAGDDSEFNMMTASWGGLGVAFGRPMAICFINPTRYTYELMEKNDTYTFTFYTEAYRDVLQYCGSASGRDKNKIEESGLTPVTMPSGSKAFAEAWMIIECKKMISQPFTADVMDDPALKAEWSGKQVNKMYIGEIINVWIK